MRRLMTTVFLVMGAALAGLPSAHAQSLLFDYVGFDYEAPNPDPGQFGESGSGYVGLGTVPFLFAPLVSNTALNEYTYVMQGLTPTSVIPVGSFRIINYSSGTITLYEDPLLGGTVGDYGANPPSGVAPGTFTDGTAILVGSLTSFQFVVDTNNGTGSFEAVFNVTGGSQFGNFSPGQARGLDVRGFERQRTQHPGRIRAPDRRADVRQLADRHAPHELGTSQGRFPMNRRMRESAAGMETNMKRWLMVMCAAMAMASVAAPAGAVGPVIDWDPAYVWQPGGTPTNLPSGGQMQVVGTVSLFGSPLAFLNATMPSTEYTFHVAGLVSGGTTTFGPPATQIYTTPYSGGVIQVYADATPDAVFAPFPPNAQVPGTFTDGAPPILVGSFTRFVVTTNNFTAFQVGNIEGDISWTGGTLLSYFGNPGGGYCPGLFTGGATWNTTPGIGIPGYLFRHDGKLDLQCPTPTQKSTWGQLKQLYR